MYLDDLPSTRVTDMRRSGALTPEMTRVTVTLQRDEGVPISTEVSVAHVRMHSSGCFCSSSADRVAGALKSFDCMQVASCAGVAPACATGARASLLFAAPSIGSSD
jgi:hypothetical protein